MQFRLQKTISLFVACPNVPVTDDADLIAGVFLVIVETLDKFQLFVFTEFRTQNRCLLLLKLLYASTGWSFFGSSTHPRRFLTPSRIFCITT